MDPVILESDLHKAYVNYYTHGDVPAAAGNNGAKLPGPHVLYDWLIKRNYWTLRYGYPAVAPAWSRWLGALVFFVPNKAFYLDTHVMFLRAVPGGRLLDVGCGNGERIELLRDLGWTVKGIDLDSRAVAAARGRGLDAEIGELAAMNFPSDSFDAVLMSHVIEHVPHPADLLAECARILKPGGRMVILTPNSESFGLDHYGRCWRGLEPPRHLQIFSRSALEQLARQAGLRLMRSRSLLAPQILRASQVIKAGAARHNGSARLRPAGSVRVKALTLIESLLLRWQSNRGEILALIATK